MSGLTDSQKRYVEKRVEERFQQTLESMIIGNRESGQEDEYQSVEKRAHIELSEFYHEARIHWHEKAYRYLSQGKAKKEAIAWENCAQAIYAYYIVEAARGTLPKLYPAPALTRDQRKGRVPESNWLLRD
jgi:hypothetical protein